jgi:hypothetical protein
MHFEKGEERRGEEKLGSPPGQCICGAKRCCWQGGEKGVGSRARRPLTLRRQLLAARSLLATDVSPVPRWCTAACSSRAPPCGPPCSPSLVVAPPIGSNSGRLLCHQHATPTHVDAWIRVTTLPPLPGHTQKSARAPHPCRARVSHARPVLTLVRLSLCAAHRLPDLQPFPLRWLRKKGDSVASSRGEELGMLMGLVVAGMK